MSGSIDVRLNLQMRDFQRKMARAQTQTKGFGSSIKKAMGAAALATAAAGLASFTKNAVQASAKMEQLRVSFTTLLGSAADAGKTIDELNNFAAQTPFRLEGIAAASRQIIAAQGHAGGLTDQLRMIGDIAATTNVPLQDMAQIYTKAMNKGKLQAEELNQLSERGIPIMRELADMYNTSAKAIFDMASKGKIGFEDLQKAFINMTSEGGIAFQAMEKQSKTLLGMWSTMEDLIEQNKTRIGNQLAPLALGFMHKWNRLLKRTGDALESLGLNMNEVKEEQVDWNEKIKKGNAAVKNYWLNYKKGAEAATTALNEQKKVFVDYIDRLQLHQQQGGKFGMVFEDIRNPSDLSTVDATDQDTTFADMQKDYNDQLIRTQQLTSNWVAGLGMAGQALALVQSKNAHVQKQFAMFNAALGIPGAYIQTLATTGNPVLAGISAGLAAAQMAVIAGTPVPSFDIGTTSFKGGPAILHPGETLTNLPAGTKVISKGMSQGGGSNDHLSFSIDGDEFVVGLTRMMNNHARR